jgi:hypothetical protein
MQEAKRRHVRSLRLLCRQRSVLLLKARLDVVDGKLDDALASIAAAKAANPALPDAFLEDTFTRWPATPKGDRRLQQAVALTPSSAPAIAIANSTAVRDRGRALEYRAGTQNAAPSHRRFPSPACADGQPSLIARSKKPVGVQTNAARSGSSGLMGQVRAGQGTPAQAGIFRGVGA